MFKLRKAFGILSKMRKKWLNNMSEKPDMINTTLDNGRSLKQFLFGVSFSLCFKLSEKGKICSIQINTKSRFASCPFQ